MCIRDRSLVVRHGVYLQALGTMLIYPNSMTFDIMEGGGIPPPPQGMLTIKVLRANGLGSAGIGKIDPFVEVRWPCLS